MKVYLNFLKGYYKTNKMQLFGPVIVIFISSIILLGSLMASQLITTQMENRYFSQFGEVSQIITSSDGKLLDEDQAKQDILNTPYTTYLQMNALQQGETPHFISLYGVEDLFFETFPVEKADLSTGVAISEKFAQENHYSVGDILSVELYGTTREYEIGSILTGDFFAREDTDGFKILLEKESLQQDLSLMVSAVAGKDVTVLENSERYTVTNTKENVTVTSQIAMIKTIVVLIDCIIAFISAYILFGFYRMSFLGKHKYLAILNTVGVTKKKLIVLL